MNLTSASKLSCVATVDFPEHTRVHERARTGACPACELSSIASGLCLKTLALRVAWFHGSLLLVGAIGPFQLLHSSFMPPLLLMVMFSAPYLVQVGHPNVCASSSSFVNCDLSRLLVASFPNTKRYTSNPIALKFY